MENPTTPNQKARQDRIVWIDCEMTGLDPQQHVLVEIAAHVTDAELNILGEGIDIVISATEEELSRMDDVVTKMHRKSGLDTEIRASKVSVAEAEQQVLAYIKQWVEVPRLAPLAGNSIASDRAFIAKYMPELDNWLHYRMIDVSSIKELARRWYPRVYFGQPPKGMSHRALADIVESIRELDYYRRSAFVPADGPTAELVDAAAEEAADRFPIPGA
nr:oligoribonuclease [Corynebacterium ulceribovis]